MDDAAFMKRALLLAQQAAAIGEVPVGALIVEKQQVIAEAFNLRESEARGIAHAELLAIDLACRKLGRWRLNGCTLIVTLEPCVMCAGAIVNSRLDRVVYGALDPKAGAVSSLYQILADTRLNHRPEVVGGVMAEESARLLSDFFKARRN
jgi:tRNA(adenine34) deaminase